MIARIKVMEVHKTRDLSGHSKRHRHARATGGQPSNGIQFLRSRRTISRLFVALILFFASPQAEGTPGLAILPFTGGVGGDGEAVAAMLWERPEIRSGFTVIPLTPEAAAVAAEHRLQMGAFTDSDLAAGVGRMLGADYVLSGHLRRLGNRNLVIATLIRVDTLELVAGYYRTYRALCEIGQQFKVTIFGGQKSRFRRFCHQSQPILSCFIGCNISK